jgi:hypothetical protein
MRRPLYPDTGERLKLLIKAADRPLRSIRRKLLQSPARFPSRLANLFLAEKQKSGACFGACLIGH